MWQPLRQAARGPEGCVEVTVAQASSSYAVASDTSSDVCVLCVHRDRGPPCAAGMQVAECLGIQLRDFSTVEAYRSSACSPARPTPRLGAESLPLRSTSRVSPTRQRPWTGRMRSGSNSRTPRRRVPFQLQPRPPTRTLAPCRAGAFGSATLVFVSYGVHTVHHRRPK